jgi:tetratricopeptide (TPR) repeat protein
MLNNVTSASSLEPTFAHGRWAPFATALTWAACTLGAARSACAQESAVPSAQAATKAAPTDPSAALALGKAYRRAGRLTPALGELRRGIAVSGGRLDVLAALHWEVARTLVDRRDWVATMTECKVLGSLPGQSAAGHACAAEAHLIWQRSTEALAEVGLALAADPRSYEAKLAEGRAYDFAIDEAKSEAAFRGAIAIDAGGVDAHLGLGRVLVRAGRRDDGLAELRSAVQMDPAGPDALFELGVALGPCLESATLLSRATRERPGFGDAWIASGDQDLAAGHLAEARHAGDAALRADSTSVKPYLLLGKVALADGREDDAIHAGEAALKLVANSAPARLIVADGNAKKGELDLALEAYQAAWGLDHGDPTPLVHASEASHASGRDTTAKAFGLKAVQEFPKWGPAWAALGDAFAGQNEKNDARDAYQKALAGEGPVDKDAVLRKLGALR